MHYTDLKLSFCNFSPNYSNSGTKFGIEMLIFDDFLFSWCEKISLLHPVVKKLFNYFWCEVYFGTPCIPAHHHTNQSERSTAVT